MQQDTAAHGGLGIVLTGGGARAAYQTGLLRWLGRQYPTMRFPYITGISAGAINAAHLASHHGTFRQATEELCALWQGLTTEDIFRTDPFSLTKAILAWGSRLLLGGFLPVPEVRSLLDTAPLRETLEEVLINVGGELTGIRYNLAVHGCRAVAFGTTSYTTGRSVIWVEGQDIELWERPSRRSVKTNLSIDHVMASAALPLFFPAIRIGNAWYGDGGIRLTAPLSPALHLGATHVMAVATRHERSIEQADAPVIAGYPPPAQVIGVLLNSVFLDVIDQDAMRLERINRLIEKLPDEDRGGMRPIRLLVLRPSVDLGRIASEHEPQLPRSFRMLTRGLGSRETASADVLSMLMFQHDYLTRLVDLGEADAEARQDEICDFIEDGLRAASDFGAKDVGRTA
ncbi:MAG TPA: patatin-like phospholipase family protein [Longimicrobiales bacterium]|nr:patatin-like phospholipase family protein [Longimicrobiales bacterium]